ncbi:polyol/monosaccharide transporter 5 [Actinidia rufa]|uniref:Polyol/monosaccharide transporter 5 n=1 Tax=Actinidia rufa TaxID=165716 RepID=A0A7J0F8R4_9ERIC|nr:polyol/monosaccharide transporter 5 [Actinidia rufa]
MKHFREGCEESAGGRRRQLRRVNRSDHEGVADSDAGDEATDHEEGVVGGKAHEEGSSEEDDGGEDDGVAAADPVGGASGGGGADEGVDVEDPHQDLQLHVRDLQIFLDVQSGSAHNPDVYHVSSQIEYGKYYYDCFENQ